MVEDGYKIDALQQNYNNRTTHDYLHGVAYNFQLQV